MQYSIMTRGTGESYRQGFTLSETLLTILIVGILAAVTLPTVQKAYPDKLEAMRKKSYYILENTVTQIHGDDTMYRQGADGNLQGFRNTERVKINGITYEGRTKFCELFANSLNKRAGVGTNCTAGQKTFTSADNVDWYMPVSDFSSGYAEVKFDVNGKAEPNCEYNASSCEKPDIFTYFVLSNGKITEQNPNLERVTHCIKTSITGRGTVLPSSNYCGLNNGTFTLTAVPESGWSSNWQDNKKTVIINNKDKSINVAFNKVPNACIKLNVICEAGTPDKCGSFGISGGTFTTEGNTLTACDLPSNKYTINVTPNNNFTSNWLRQEVTLNGNDQNLSVLITENKYCAILNVNCPEGSANICGNYVVSGNGTSSSMDISGNVAKSCALKNGSFNLLVTPKTGFKSTTTSQAFTISDRDWSGSVKFIKNMLGLIEIPCSKFQGYDDCESVMVENEDTVATEYLGTRNDGKDYDLMCANKNGDQMCWGLADKVCKDKGLRLPTASELHAMWEASKNGTISPFESADYWANNIGNGYAHNCYMGAGNCGRGNVNYYTDRHVRCVQ